MYKHLFIGFFCLVSLNSFAGSEKKDSLINVYQSLQDDTNKVKTLLYLGREVNNKLDSAIQVYQSALDLSNNLDYNFGKVESLLQLSRSNWFSGNQKLADKYIEQALEDCKNKKQKAIIFNLMGVYKKEVGNFPEALNYYFKALKINEEIGRDYWIAALNNNIGVVYQEQGDFEGALKYHKKALKTREETNDKGGMSDSYNNIGVIHIDQGNHEKALESFEASLALRKDINDKEGIAACYNNIGVVYEEQKKYQEALEAQQKALEIRVEIGDKLGYATSYENIGVVYCSLKQYDKAKKYLHDALELALKYGLLMNTKNIYDELAVLYEALGDYKSAYTYHKEYLVFADSIKNEELTRKILEQSIKFDYQKKALADSISNAKEQHIQNLEFERNKAELESKQSQQYALLAIIFVIIIFSLFLWNRFSVIRKQKRVIEEVNEEITQTNEELNQTNEEIAAQRDEIERQKEVVEGQQKDIISSIRYAKRIQTALLKNEEHESAHLPPHFILFKPKDIVSGDFYWALEKDGCFYIAAVDCTGHGVPGGFLTMLGTSFLNEINSVTDLLSPAEILNQLRDKIIKELASDEKTKDGMDISLLKMDLKTREAEWAGANNPLYILRNGEIIITRGDREPIGPIDQPTPFTNHQISLKEGDIVYLFTDGYSDQFGGVGGKKLSYQKFRELLIKNCDKPMEEQKQALDSYFMQWMMEGYEDQLDDVCVIGMKL